MNARHVAGAVVGMVAAIGPIRSIRRSSVEDTALAGAGLVSAAAIYPLARSRWAADGAVARELGGLAATGLLSVAAARRTGSTGAWLLAAGWLSHAAFDVYHEAGPHSRLPAWYPAACAGFDIGMAAALVAPR
jgi:hypothetical protein